MLNKIITLSIAVLICTSGNPQPVADAGPFRNLLDRRASKRVQNSNSNQQCRPGEPCYNNSNLSIDPKSGSIDTPMNWTPNLTGSTGQPQTVESILPQTVQTLTEQPIATQAPIIIQRQLTPLPEKGEVILESVWNQRDLSSVEKKLALVESKIQTKQVELQSLKSEKLQLEQEQLAYVEEQRLQLEHDREIQKLEMQLKIEKLEIEMQRAAAKAEKKIAALTTRKVELERTAGSE